MTEKNGDVGPSVKEFSQTLKDHNLTLTRIPPTVLQLNVGLICNQVCKHCHLSAGPSKTEIMSRETMGQILDFQKKNQLPVVDITGGAPEMNPHLMEFIDDLAPVSPSMMIRSNLSALDAHNGKEDLMALLARHKVGIVASFPALNPSQTDAQRGKGIFDISLAVLKELNAIGYGRPDTGLALDLVSNPSGAFMPPGQEAAQKRFHREMARKWGIEFNQLFTFANVPLGRFKSWLERSGNHEKYLTTLANAFNPCTVDGLMCRSMISVSWDGFLHDCDFNQAAGIGMGNQKFHISEIDEFETFMEEKIPAQVAVGNHCYACTAGAGFT